MTKEEMLKRLHEILEIVGPDRAFEISGEHKRKKNAMDSSDTRRG